MRTIGLIGGMSWESSAEYYRLINQGVKAELGGHHNAKTLMYTVDFAQIEALQRSGDWDAAGALLAEAATALERGGAEYVALCTNTMHVVAEAIENAIDVPFVHLVDAVAASARAGGPGTVGLLGTRFTMEMGFYAERMARHGIEVLVPAEAEREAVHEIIYGELTLGQVREASREVYREVMAGLVSRGAAGIVFGCTEITLLVDASDSPVPVFDSTRIHTERLVELALG